MEITPAFSVPIISDQLKDCEKLNRELRDVFVAYEQEGEKYANPDPFVSRNEQLYESHFTLFNWSDQCIQTMARFCLSRLYQAVQDLNRYDNDTMKRLQVSFCESWFHITRKGGYFGVHNHPMHSWSGVYCVRQDGDRDIPGSGELTFIHPNFDANMFKDMTNSRLQPPYGMGNRNYRLQPGQLILFPSWLLHWVTPYEGDGERITVAFNVRFRYQGVAPPKNPGA